MASPANTSDNFGYDANFDPPLEQRYMCSICLGALRDPVQIVCGHRFCHECLMKTKPRPNSTSVKCPFHKDSFNLITQIFYDNAVKREVLSLTVKCSYEHLECLWRGELRDLQKHVTLCPKVEKPCRLCAVLVKQGDMDAHLSVCPRRVELCPNCGVEVVFEELFKHQVLKCPKFPVACALCGHHQLLREDIPKHVAPDIGDCPQATLHCPLNQLGCTYQVQRCKMDAHLNTSVSHHAALFVRKLASIDNVMRNQEEMLQSLTKTTKDLLDRSQHVERMLELFTARLSTQMRRLEELESTSYSGTLLWQVKLSGTSAPQLHSPLFYTGVPGYALMLILEKDREYQDNPTTLWICYCQGRYDSQLFFPFRIQCKIRIFMQLETDEFQDFQSVVKCLCGDRVLENGYSKVGEVDLQSIGELYECIKNGLVQIHCSASLSGADTGGSKLADGGKLCLDLSQDCSVDITDE